MARGIAGRPVDPPPVHEQPGAGSVPGLGLGGSGAGRNGAVDNLKVLLIAVVIVIHAVMGYAAFFDGWPYAEVQEVHLPDAVVITVFVLFAPIGLCMMALLFLIAGLLTPPSIARKGPGRFARDRLLRLGVPFAAFVLLLWPLTLYAMFRSLGRTKQGYWAYFTSALPSNGPLWFVGLLLMVSLAYAAWAARSGTAARPVRPVSTAALLRVAAAVAVLSFLVRLTVSYGGPTPLDLNEWQWPECIALFGVGIAASPHGWLAAVPELQWRAARRVTAVAGAGVALFLLTALALGVPQQDFLGGAHWAALVVACLEGLLTVFGSLWMLAAAQRHLTGWTRHGPALARSAYGAFVIQTPVLIGLALALRPLPVPVPADIKAATVALGGLALSFAIARLLTTRVRPLGRLL